MNPVGRLLVALVLTAASLGAQDSHGSAAAPQSRPVDADSLAAAHGARRALAVPAPAAAAGLGHELPDDWFSETVHP